MESSVNLLIWLRNVITKKPHMPGKQVWIDSHSCQGKALFSTDTPHHRITVEKKLHAHKLEWVQKTATFRMQERLWTRHLSIWSRAATIAWEGHFTQPYPTVKKTRFTSESLSRACKVHLQHNYVIVHTIEKHTMYLSTHSEVQHALQILDQAT